jgi:hypothetical protein
LLIMVAREGEWVVCVEYCGKGSQSLYKFKYKQATGRYNEDEDEDGVRVAVFIHS